MAEAEKLTTNDPNTIAPPTSGAKPAVEELIATWSERLANAVKQTSTAETERLRVQVADQAARIATLEEGMRFQIERESARSQELAQWRQALTTIETVLKRVQDEVVSAEERLRQVEKQLTGNLNRVAEQGSQDLLNALDLAERNLHSAADAVQERILFGLRQAVVSTLSTEKQAVVQELKNHTAKHAEVIGSKRGEILGSLQSLAQQASAARDQAQAQAVEAARLLGETTQARDETISAALQEKTVIERATKAAEQAEHAGDEATKLLNQLNSKMTEVTKLDHLIAALYGAVAQIQDASASTTMQNQSVRPTKSPVPAALTPKTAEFDFLTLFTLIVHAQWPEILQAARSTDTGYFISQRLDDLDLALYGDPRQLLSAGMPDQEPVAYLIEKVKAGQRQCIEELKAVGMLRIEGHPLDRKKPYWLEPDYQDAIETTDPALADTFAEIRPGKGGYELHDQALRPSLARFYRLEVLNIPAPHNLPDAVLDVSHEKPSASS